MKLYLAGPMRGYPEFNHPAFHAAAAELRASGHAVFNPAEHAESLGINTTGMTGDPSHEELAGYSLRELIAADLAWICANAEANRPAPRMAGLTRRRSRGSNSQSTRHPGRVRPGLPRQPPMTNPDCGCARAAERWKLRPRSSHDLGLNCVPGVST